MASGRSTSTACCWRHSTNGTTSSRSKAEGPAGSASTSLDRCAASPFDLRQLFLKSSLTKCPPHLPSEPLEESNPYLGIPPHKCYPCTRTLVLPMFPAV